MKTRITGRFAAFADFEIEAYLCDELPLARRVEIENARAVDPELHAYIHEREQTRSQFAALHPLRLPHSAGPRVIARGLLLWTAAIAVPALAFGLWWVGIQPQVHDATGAAPTVRDQNHDTVRVKGTGIATELYIKRGEQVFRHRAEQSLKPGDRVRLSVDAPSAGYLSLLARDQRGTVSVYYDRLRLTAAGRFTVPDSLLLDASVGDELWLVVLASDARPAHEYAAAFGSRDAPGGATYSLIPVHKEKP